MSIFWLLVKKPFWEQEMIFFFLIWGWFVDLSYLFAPKRNVVDKRFACTFLYELEFKHNAANVTKNIFVEDTV